MRSSWEGPVACSGPVLQIVHSSSSKWVVASHHFAEIQDQSVCFAVLGSSSRVGWLHPSDPREPSLIRSLFLTISFAPWSSRWLSRAAVSTE